eukprot:341283-Chlamydomonas_euryale.AAC.4
MQQAPAARPPVHTRACAHPHLDAELLGPRNMREQEVLVPHRVASAIHVHLAALLICADAQHAIGVLLACAPHAVWRVRE